MSHHYKDFGNTRQGGETKILSSIYKRYWEIGFRTRLYEWLSPKAYVDSVRRTAEYVEKQDCGTILDAGCGSGMLFSHLSHSKKAGMTYVGMDILKAGLRVLKNKGTKPTSFRRKCILQADFRRSLPFKNEMFSCTVAHFSIYTLPERGDREKVYQELWRVLEPNGRLIAANPVRSYDAVRVIRHSLSSLKGRINPIQWWLKKYFLYPFALHFGLKHVERQLRTGVWHAGTAGEIENEIQEAGFLIEHSESVYADCGWLVVARKTS